MSNRDPWWQDALGAIFAIFLIPLGGLFLFLIALGLADKLDAVLR